jgi:hypothetical protein
MSPELIGILAVGATLLAAGAALAGLILTSNRGLRQDVARLESRLREDMKQSESHLRVDLKQPAERVARLEHGQAKLEGLLEGLREAVTQAG